jgi:peroxiredoxin
MRLQPGHQAVPITLPAIDGSMFDTGSLRGRPYLLSFFRFAACPFCNLRVHELATRRAELGSGFEIVAVFDSPLDNLVRHAERHQAPFPILADEGNRYYMAYGIEHSLSGVVKGMVLRLPTMLRAMARGYVPTSIAGSMTTMPADFLIDAQGIVRQAYYGADEGDHLPFEQVRAFARAQAKP